MSGVGEGDVRWEQTFLSLSERFKFRLFDYLRSS